MQSKAIIALETRTSEVERLDLKPRVESRADEAAWGQAAPPRLPNFVEP